ncbi:MAG: hypothetical protein CMH31_05385 [Micavibrio sp.]|nr:hypothetical protein [Micavibrio sp.]|tara:strand:+ start:684 stop:998 length:315 start_codon:yes stop_codon:yes gene_type:complete
MVQYGQIFELAQPSLEGCQSCGSSLLDCQCIKFDAEAKRNGFSMDDLAQQAPLTAFSLYGQPNPPAMHSAPEFSGQNASAIATATAQNGASATMASASPSSGMF